MLALALKFLHHHNNGTFISLRYSVRASPLSPALLHFTCHPRNLERHRDGVCSRASFALSTVRQSFLSPPFAFPSNLYPIYTYPLLSAARHFNFDTAAALSRFNFFTPLKIGHPSPIPRLCRFYIPSFFLSSPPEAEAKGGSSRYTAGYLGTLDARF